MFPFCEHWTLDRNGLTSKLYKSFERRITFVIFYSQMSYFCHNNSTHQRSILIDNFWGEPLMKFLCGVQVGPRTRITLWKSRKCIPWFVDSLHPSTMCYDFFYFQSFRQLINIKICVWRWSWEKIFDFQFHSQILTIFYGSGSTSQARSRRFIEVWPQFAPQSKMALLTPKLSIFFLAFYMYFNKCMSPYKITHDMKFLERCRLFCLLVKHAKDVNTQKTFQKTKDVI